MANLKPTVTVAVSAYNEESNIKAFLESVLLQKEVGFKLKKIVVISDGSTDSTVFSIENIKDKRITLLKHNKRRGLAIRLNEAFNISESDILIKFDADVIPANDLVIANLVKKFGNNVGLVGGFRKAISTGTFIEKVHMIGDDIWHNSKKTINDGENIHNHHGTISAMSSRLYKSLIIPSNLYGIDDFIYIKNYLLGLNFVFTEDAFVYYQNPTNLHDYFKQHRRFLSAKINLQRYFDTDISALYLVPKKKLLISAMKAMLKSPILSFVYFYLETFVRISLKIKKYGNNKYGWDLSTSTKNLSFIRK